MEDGAEDIDSDSLVPLSLSLVEEEEGEAAATTAERKGKISLRPIEDESLRHVSASSRIPIRRVSESFGVSTFIHFWQRGSSRSSSDSVGSLADASGAATARWTVKIRTRKTDSTVRIEAALH
ncbi:hypothetical protein AAC387_Pa02g0391 [Persea americana]